MDKRVSEFARLLNDAQAAGTESQLFLQLMDPAAAHQFRLCAIPHQYDAEIVRVLVPTLSRTEAERLCLEFAAFAAVTPLKDGWALHERWRRELFAQWLTPARLDEFRTASQRLADFFEPLARTSSGDAQEIALRRRMYHLLGADVTAGLSEFERLCRRARSQLRYSECAALIRMVHDYDALLTPEQRAIVAYHQAKLSSDERDWAAAERQLRELIVGSPPDSLLLAKAHLRLGYVLAQQRRTAEAIATYNTAQDAAADMPDATTLMMRVLHEMGVVYRDTGDPQKAEGLLLESANTAESLHEWGIYATAHNSLGVLYLRQHQPKKAIAAFEMAADRLEQAQDVVRASQVFNNIALAYTELADWASSEFWLLKSLESKRRSGDVLGQALVLNNLVRVHLSQERLEDAITEGLEAVRLFELAQDQSNAALAQRNIAKYYLRRGNKYMARKYYGQAIETYALARDGQGEAGARADLASLDEKQSLPWWVWVSIVIVALFTTIVLGLLAYALFLQ